MRRNILVIGYLEFLQSLYDELKEYQDFGFPLPKRHFAYYQYLLAQIAEIKSCITEEYKEHSENYLFHLYGYKHTGKLISTII